MKVVRHILCLFLCLLSVTAWANSAMANSFTIKHIRIVGLRHISRGTVLNYLPLHVGERYSANKSGTILNALYKTGFFARISLARQGNTLVINVVERPVISDIKFSGNHVIKKDQMKKVLKAEGLTVGSIYKRAIVTNFKQVLVEQYYNLGHYNARVTVHVKHGPRDRVAIAIKVSEGSIAKIKQIKIIGNHAFSERTLLRQFKLTTPKLWSFITHSDRYSRAKLRASLEALRSYYQDHGYIKIKVDSTHVAITPDRRHVYITIRVTEGPLYHFSDYRLAGNLILKRKQLRHYVTIEKNAVFSKKVVENSAQAIGTALGEKGYAFAQIQPVPRINEKKRTVFVTFSIHPGNKVYVRRIIFKGNTITQDRVLRYQVQQMEGGLINTSKIKNSVRQLNLLGFVKDIQVKTVPVPGKPNQVDLVYSLKEAKAGRISVSAGYGTDGLTLGAGITEPNFLGSGKTVALNFSKNQYVTTYSFNYYNPYYRIDGIGRGYSVYYQRVTPGAINLTNYFLDIYGGQTYYNILLSEDNSLQVGLGYKHVNLTTSRFAATEVRQFIARKGSNFNQIVLNGGWSYVGVDRAIFPTDGLDQGVNLELSVPSGGQPLQYYKVGYDAHYYHPLNRSRSFVLEFSGGVGYGAGYGQGKRDNALPFFYNYYAGGLSQGMVRGFETNTLGPRVSVLVPVSKTRTITQLRPIGGNFLVYGSAAIIFPNFISSDKLRTSIFVDVGNVYQTNSALKRLQARGAGPLRYSVGFGVEWRSPIGPLTFSVAKALNKRPGDETQIFQFTMGTVF